MCIRDRFKYLEEAGNITESSAYWEDNYTTAMVYMSIAPLERWKMKSLIRNWMIMRDQSGTYTDSHKIDDIYYALAIADENSIGDLTKSATVSVYINNHYIGEVEFARGDYVAKSILKVDSDKINKGDNTIKFSVKGEGDVYVMLKQSVLVKDTYENSEISMKKEYYDIDGKRILDSSKIKKGTPLRIRITVNSDKDYTDVVVRDIYPSGITPINFMTAGVSKDIINRYWSYRRNENVNLNKSGHNFSDSVIYRVPELRREKEYIFEYVAIAEFGGEYAGGISSVGVEGFPEAGIKILNSDMIIK